MIKQCQVNEHLAAHFKCELTKQKRNADPPTNFEVFVGNMSILMHSLNVQGVSSSRLTAVKGQIPV